MPPNSESDAVIDGYDFALPERLIAQEPAPVRTGSRLLVVPKTGPHRHLRFADLPSLLEDGDLLLVNDTRVLPARLTARRRTGGQVRLLALGPLPEGGWRCLVKPSAKVKPGEVLTLQRRGSGEPGPPIRVDEVLDGARRVSGVSEPLAALLGPWGEMPLPPYIDRSEGPRAEDRERYQTVYAAEDGAVAAPTAGLHFDGPLLDTLAAKGVRAAAVTLHVGAGTFAPVRVRALDDLEMHAEQYRVSPETARAIAAVEDDGGRIVCVGTTSARALESWHRAGRPVDGAWRTTRLFLRPGDPPQATFSLITNFHLPRSTLLVLVSSLLGRERTLDLYREAVEHDYRFFSYGDASLLL